MSEYDQLTLEDLSRTFAGYVSLAADDIQSLRKCDIDRVLEQAQSLNELQALSDYLYTARPDFAVDEICELEAEISSQRGWK